MSEKEKDALDLENRDPCEINEHLKVSFHDVLAEPEGVHSNDCVWRCSYRCFNGSKNCCYRTLTVFCGCIFALCWGCEFACITFFHVWQGTPALRIFALNCGCLQRFWGTALQCFLAPICETMGLCLSRIQVTRGLHLVNVSVAMNLLHAYESQKVLVYRCVVVVSLADKQVD
ncbi:hypothetical protein LSH36_244g03004 [Paralvinella palmiformis]|uniref:Caveolin n=1 Tax=Paralvinella palmiformis TaxID=53620 RepID=A0AAD9N4M4_9ANNE|nr:hypothetical protein LSH36_244g03004 [Paralvinella palmiformis]